MGNPDPGISAHLSATGVLGAHIPAVALTAGYRLGLALGASLVSVFPLLYIALIPLAAWAVYALAWASGRTPFVVFLVAGCLLILSLLKPLLARPGSAAEPHFLDRDTQPLLFAFVRELADGAGMPEPSRIAVDCGVNCFCIFSGGLISLLRSGFVLVIGLPLVSGLRLDQLGGVLAHELGHATQRATLRSSRVVWTVHAWFARVAFERDAVDERLGAWLAGAGPGTRLALWVTRLLFLPGRGILRLLTLAESVASSVFLRRMELDADRCQVRVSGTAAFLSTVQEVNLLALAAQAALVELSRTKREGWLTDDYPGLAASLRARYSVEFAQRLLAGLEEGHTGLFSAHPSDKDRMALARAEPARGILTDALPAAILFADYDALCRQVTLEFYDQELGVMRAGYELRRDR